MAPWLRQMKVWGGEQVSGEDTNSSYRSVTVTRAIMLRRPPSVWRVEDAGDRVVLVSPRGAWYAMPAVGGFLAVCIFLGIWWQTGGPREAIAIGMFVLAGLCSLAVAMWGLGRGRRVEVRREDVWLVEEFLWGAMQRRVDLQSFKLCMCRLHLDYGTSISEEMFAWRGWALCWLTRTWSRGEAIAVFATHDPVECEEYLKRLPATVQSHVSAERFEITAR